MITPCDLKIPYLNYRQEIDLAIRTVLESGHYILGPEVDRFEKNFTHFLNAQFGVATANGTDSLVMCLKSLNIGPGDEVITTPFTAIPTVSAIIATGATPVFVDIDPRTLLIDLNQVYKKISAKTRVFMPVHIFGNVVDVEKFQNETYGKIPVIEDACQAHGSKLGSRFAGTMGDFGAFSFYPTKNLGAMGDGGFISTRTEEAHAKLKLIRQYGMVTRDQIVINGINSRLDEVQAAILNVKLKYLDDLNKRRAQIAQIYMKNLNTNFIDFQKIEDNVTSNFHVFPIILKDKVQNLRDKLVKYLEEKSILTNVYYRTPLPFQEANKYLNISRGSLPIAEQVCNKILSLPIYPELTPDEVNYIIETVNSFWSLHL